MPKERIGIMGGSFNPIHERHMELACSALAEYRLNRVLFIPTGNPPHKHDGLAPAEDRYEMTRLAVSGKPGFGASRVELDRKGVIYTVDTLTRLSRQRRRTACSRSRVARASSASAAAAAYSHPHSA